jgi:hypothetical protein
MDFVQTLEYSPLINEHAGVQAQPSLVVMVALPACKQERTG